MKVTVSKSFSFEYAHILPWHPGKCSRLHGHSGKLKVSVKRGLDENGVVMDFSDLSKIIHERVIERLDHSFLNDFLSNPTSELLLHFIWKELEKELEGLEEIEFRETDSTSATLRREDVPV